MTTTTTDPKADPKVDSREVSKAEVNHPFNEDETQAYMAPYKSADGNTGEVFYAVTDPSWASDNDKSYPIATVAFILGPNETAAAYFDKIEAFQDEGMRVVVIDPPGVGHSSDNAIIGNANLLHTDSVQEYSDAIQKALGDVNKMYGATPGGLTLVSSSLGSVVAEEVIKDMPAGTVNSLVMVNPVRDMDFYATGDRRFRASDRLFGYDKDSVDPLADTTAEIEALTGAHLNKLLDGEPARWTRGYTDQFAAAVDNNHDNRAEFMRLLARNNIVVGIVYDSEIDGLFDADETADWIAEAKALSVNVTDTKMDGEGPDLMFNPGRKEELEAAIIGTMQRGSVFVDLTQDLKTIHREEWNDDTTLADRKDIQSSLESKGYSVGWPGVDGVISHGEISFTYAAIAEFLIDAGKDGKLCDADGSLKLSDIRDADFTPERIKEIVENTEFQKPELKVEPATPSSSPALISQQ